MDANVPNDPMGERGDFQMPSIEELLKALENMDTIPEESKEEIKASLLAQAQGKPPVEAAKNSGIPPDLLILFLLISVVILVFVFFGYKLYKSLAERERRKEEKRRQKQQKKKK